MIRAIACPYFRRAFGWCVPIGGLGGLIGLGGGEFRLPVLMHGIGFDARSAVPLNLLISLVTLSFALAFRSGAVSLGAVVPYLPAMLGLVAGGMASAIVGARFVSRLTDRRLVRLIAILLGMLGLLLMTESFLPFPSGDLLPPSPAAHLAAGFVIGVGVGLVSSMLGVAGGELLIPALVLIFGADIKTAGSASILISLGIVGVGLWRFWQAGALPAWRGARRITTAMALGSILGAMLGGLAVAYAPVAFLKLLLGAVLLAAAAKTIKGTFMSDDPRWQVMLDFVAWAETRETGGDEFARRFQEDYIAVAEAIAANRTVPARDRAIAREIVAQFARAVRANAPALLAATAKVVRDPNTPTAERAEFAELLARAVEAIPAASDTRH